MEAVPPPNPANRPPLADDAGTTPPAVLRPARADDGQALWDLLGPARDEVVGMVSLPSSLDDARGRCASSAATIAELAAGGLEGRPGTSRSVLLVLDEGDGRLSGVTGFSAKWEYPNVAVRILTGSGGRGLQLVGEKEPWTCTELNATFLGPAARGRGLGTLLSRARFLLLALVAEQVPETLVSHLRGPFGPGGSAPFWQSYGVQVAPQWLTSDAAERGLVAHPDRLDELADHAIDIEPRLLEIVGSVNRLSLPAFHLLMAEGLRPNGLFDPVDGGPTLAGPIRSTRTWRRRIPVGPPPVEPTDTRSSPPPGSDTRSDSQSDSRLDSNSDNGSSLDALVATDSVEGFRAVRSQVVPSAAGVRLTAAAARLLVDGGDPLDSGSAPTPVSGLILDPDQADRVRAYADEGEGGVR